MSNNQTETIMPTPHDEYGWITVEGRGSGNPEWMTDGVETLSKSDGKWHELCGGRELVWVPGYLYRRRIDCQPGFELVGLDVTLMNGDEFTLDGETWHPVLKRYHDRLPARMYVFDWPKVLAIRRKLPPPPTDKGAEILCMYCGNAIKFFASTYIKCWIHSDTGIAACNADEAFPCAEPHPSTTPTQQSSRGASPSLLDELSESTGLTIDEVYLRLVVLIKLPKPEPEKSDGFEAYLEKEWVGHSLTDLQKFLMQKAWNAALARKESTK